MKDQIFIEHWTFLIMIRRAISHVVQLILLYHNTYKLYSTNKLTH